MERIEVCCPQSGGEEHFSGCLICGAELVYNSLGTERRCAVCGRESAGNAVCANGHYVCDECHAYGAFAAIIPELYKSREKNPLLLLDSVMNLPSVHMHGPEHHVIVPLVLLTALRNNGGDISYDEAMREAYKRASKLPGGTCGFGACAARRRERAYLPPCFSAQARCIRTHGRFRSSLSRIYLQGLPR